MNILIDLVASQQTQGSIPDLMSQGIVPEAALKSEIADLKKIVYRVQGELETVKDENIHLQA